MGKTKEVCQVCHLQQENDSLNIHRPQIITQTDTFSRKSFMHTPALSLLSTGTHGTPFTIGAWMTIFNVSHTWDSIHHWRMIDHL